MSELRKFIQALSEVGILDGDNKPERIIIAMKALRPLVSEPSGDMKACAVEIEERVSRFLGVMNWGEYLNILSNHWPDKPELDIDSVAKELKQRTVPFLMELQDGVNKKSVIGFYRSILSKHFKQSQGAGDETDHVPGAQDMVEVVGDNMGQGVDVEAFIDELYRQGMKYISRNKCEQIVLYHLVDIGPLKKQIAELEGCVSFYGDKRHYDDSGVVGVFDEDGTMDEDFGDYARTTLKPKGASDGT